MIRAATQNDIPAILRIWNPVIRDTTVTFTSAEKTGDELARMLAARGAAGRAFLVADDGVVRGFASYDRFRGGDGYAHAMEHSLMLAPDARRMGLGSALLAALEHHARGAGHHTMHGGVSAENAAGIAFHSAQGYATLAVIPEVGRKYGRWLDLVLMQKRL